MEERKKKIGIVIITLLSIIIILGGSYFIYQVFQDDQKEPNDILEPTPTPTNPIQDEEEKRNGKKLTVYYYASENYAAGETNPYSKEEPTIYSVTCVHDDCNFIDEYDSFEDDYVLVSDSGDTTLFNYKKDEIVETFAGASQVRFIVSNDGLVIKKDDKFGIYNYRLQKLTVPYQYDDVKEVANFSIDVRGPMYDTILGNSLLMVKNNKYGAVDVDTGKTTLDFDYDEILCYQSYYNDAPYGLYPDSYCKAKEKGSYTIFHYNSNDKSLIRLSKTYDNFYEILDAKYAYVYNDKKLELITLPNEEIIAEYDGFNEFDRMFFMTYYEDVNKNSNVLIQFQNQQETCTEYIYNEVTKKSEKKDNVNCAEIAKPILYLYPTEKENVTVSFGRKDLLTTTYPKFIDHWQVTAEPDGTLHDKNGKYYYGLYWEENFVHHVNFETGFYVEKEGAISFLEEKLNEIGLNDKERNEFIMYWLPILEKNEKNLVYFELTEERESVNPILINPNPDSLLRIVIHVKKVDSKVDIQEEKLSTFVRHGFTAVEWGGINY